MSPLLKSPLLFSSARQTKPTGSGEKKGTKLHHKNYRASPSLYSTPENQHPSYYSTAGAGLLITAASITTFIIIIII